jgi:hypothetical protein
MAMPAFASIGEIVYVTFDLSQAHLIDLANEVRVVQTEADSNPVPGQNARSDPDLRHS